MDQGQPGLMPVRPPRDEADQEVVHGLRLRRGHDGAQAHPKGSVAEKLYTGTVRSSTEFLSLSATSDLQDIQS